MVDTILYCTKRILQIKPFGSCKDGASLAQPNKIVSDPLHVPAPISPQFLKENIFGIH